MEVVEGGIWCGFNQHYELDYINFMIEVLKPFIEFQRSNILEGTPIRICLKRSGKMNEVIDIKKFIHFIQKTFPEIIKKEINIINSEIYSINCERDAFKALISMSIEDYKQEYINNHKIQKDPNVDYQKFIDMDWNEMDKMREFYGFTNKYNVNCTMDLQNTEYYKKRKYLNNKSTYFSQLFKFNFINHGLIEDVLKFINNLEYVI